MSLPHALLTSLIEKSSSGFELARRFDKSIGYFWHATHQQIYRELARMEEAGWIASAPAADAGQTRKREYRVLRAGRTELRRWALEPAAPIDLRDALTVKLRACANLDTIDLSTDLQNHIQQHAQQLAQYQDIEARDFSSTESPSRSSQIKHMILKRGIAYEESCIAWILDMLHLLKAPDPARRHRGVK